MPDLLQILKLREKSNQDWTVLFAEPAFVVSKNGLIFNRLLN